MRGSVDLGLVKGSGVQLCTFVVTQLLVDFVHLYLRRFGRHIQFSSFFVIWFHLIRLAHLAIFAMGIVAQAAPFHANTPKWGWRLECAPPPPELADVLDPNQ